MTTPPSVGGALAQSGLVPVDARALMMHVLGVDRAWLVAHDRDALSAAQAHAFFTLAKRRREGEPVAYLVGRREFYGLDLVVTPAVLIPRPETEVAVESALARLPADRAARVLDLGTGSGAIALAIANARPSAHVVGTDASDEALRVASGNAARLGIPNVAFVRSDWYAALDTAPFDVIVSNPPYVDARDPHLAQGDLRFEPRTALVPGDDALAALKAIVLGAPAHVSEGGSLVVEHGHDQSAAVCGLFETAGFGDIRRFRDLAGIDRVVAGRGA